MTENVRVALISASAAIFGAVAGGGATYITTQQAQRAEDRRQERMVDRQVRGAARHLIAELSISATYVDAMARHDRTLDLGANYPVSVEPADERDVYARLSQAQYKLVVIGLKAIQLVAATVEDIGIDERLGDPGQAIMETSYDAVRRAVDALRSVADARNT